MGYEVKPGQGSLFQNKSANKSDKAPSYKGFFRLPDGSVVGLALWKIDTKNGPILSLKLDEREGEYQSKQNGWPLFAGGASPGGQRQSRHSRHDDDLDDEIPF